MATRPSTLSPFPTQSLPHDLAAIRAWVALKAVCGHSARSLATAPPRCLWSLWRRFARFWPVRRCAKPNPADFTRAGFHVSHALVATCKRPRGMSDSQVLWRLHEIAHDIYHAKLEFLATVDDLAQEAMELALVEKVKGGPSDEEMLQCEAYKLIRQGIDAANTGLDETRTGIDIAGRAFRMSRKAQAAQ